MKNQNYYTLRAENGENGLNIYLDTGKTMHFITSCRLNDLVYNKLRSGTTLGELKRAKSYNTRIGQKYYNSARYILKLADNFIKK
jgi:hypothetical protein